MESNVSIYPYKLNTIPADGTLVFIGKRRSGKSTNMLNVLKHFKDYYEFGFVFCGTISMCGEYKKHIPADFVRNDLDLDCIDNLIHFQEQRIKDKTVKPVFILVDDFAFDTKLTKSKTFSKLFKNGRHYNICFMLGLQYSTSIGPDMRGNVDVCFLNRELNRQNRERLYKQYVSGFDDYADFETYFLQITKSHTTMVIDNDNKSDSNFPVYYWKSSYPVPAFRMNAFGIWWRSKRELVNLIAIKKKKMLATINKKQDKILLEKPRKRSNAASKTFYKVLPSEQNPREKYIPQTFHTVSTHRRGIAASTNSLPHRTNTTFNVRPQYNDKPKVALRNLYGLNSFL